MDIFAFGMFYFVKRFLIKFVQETLMHYKEKHSVDVLYIVQYHMIFLLIFV